MPNGPALPNPTPRVLQGLGYDPTLPAPWTQPESVTDSSLTKAMRLMSKMLGTDDPAGQIMGMAGAMDVPGAVGPLQKAVSGLVKRIRAYHGSPHDFDAFSLDKIGTGEGAQAYGHGLYFAEEEAVAKGYRDMWPADQRGPRVKVDGRNIYELAAETSNPVERRAYKRLIEDGDVDAAIRNAGPDTSYPDTEAAALLSQWKQTRNFETPSGRMYEVEINADPSDFLDWDKPLSQQSEKVKAALAKAGVFPPTEVAAARDRAAKRLFGRSYEELQGDDAATAMIVGNQATAETGREAHHALSRRIGSYASDAGPAGATDALRKQGVAGIKYLDGMSRNTGEGTSNYVVFDDKLISILRKYGVAGATGAGYTAQQIQQAQEQMK